MSAIWASSVKSSDSLYLLNTDVFKDEICTMMAGMFSYTISPEEERRIISDITSRASRINRYFVKSYYRLNSSY